MTQYTAVTTVVARQFMQQWNTPPSDGSPISLLTDLVVAETREVFDERVRVGELLPYSMSIEISEWPDGPVVWRLEAELRHHENEDMLGWFMKWGYVNQPWQSQTTDPAIKQATHGLGRVSA